VFACACIRTGRLDEAEAMIAALPDEEVHSTAVRLARGELALQRREPALAATYFQAAIAEPAADVRAEAVTEAIVVYASHGYVNEAVEMLGTLKLPPPVAARGWMNVGIAHARNGVFAEAVECFGEAARLDPDSAEIRLLLDRARAAARATPPAEDVPNRSSGLRKSQDRLRS
jgi:predicted Zn-dependent protease